MIDTLAQSGPYTQHTLSFTEIDFGEDKAGVKRMDRPLYRSLFNYPLAPGRMQFEPCFQIRSNPQTEIQIEFKIRHDAPIEFMRRGKGVECLSIYDRNQTLHGLVENELINAKHCKLTWNQSKESQGLTVLRLRCARTDGESETAEEIVEGGLYLAIVHRSQSWKPGKRALKNPGGPMNNNNNTIKIYGIDEQARPVYDLFNQWIQQVHGDLEFEPAFRVREGGRVDFALAFDLPDPLSPVVFRPDNSGRVAISGFIPEGQPHQLLRHDFVDPWGKKCALRWIQQTGRSSCRNSTKDSREKGYANSFLLQVQNWPHSMERFKDLLQGGAIDEIHALLGELVFELDPTVIQPPVCTVTADGQTVCMPSVNQCPQGGGSLGRHGGD